MPYSRHNARKLSVCCALSANSVLVSIRFLGCHGISQQPYTAGQSVTYVLNLLCILCLEPAPTKHQTPCAATPFLADTRPAGRMALGRGGGGGGGAGGGGRGGRGAPPAPP